MAPLLSNAHRATEQAANPQCHGKSARQRETTTLSPSAVSHVCLVRADARLTGSCITFESMSSHLLPANPSLLAVALIIRAKDGPRFVFNYPARPDTNVCVEHPNFGTELGRSPCVGEDEDDTASEDVDHEDELEYLLQRDPDSVSMGGRTRRGASLWDGDLHFDFPPGRQVVPWEHFDQYSTKDLASILTPKRYFHRDMFTLSLPPLHFVSYPVHALENGTWKKRRVKRKKIRPKLDDSDVAAVDDGPESPALQESVIYDEESPQAEVDNTKRNFDAEGITMFSVVLIANPRRSEVQTRCSDLYEHVAKHINSALRIAQDQDGYVWREARTILAMKEKAREESKSVFMDLRVRNANI